MLLSDILLAACLRCGPGSQWRHQRHAAPLQPQPPARCCCPAGQRAPHGGRALPPVCTDLPLPAHHSPRQNVTKDPKGTMAPALLHSHACVHNQHYTSDDTLPHTTLYDKRIKSCCQKIHEPFTCIHELSCVSTCLICEIGHVRFARVVHMRVGKVPSKDLDGEQTVSTGPLIYRTLPQLQHPNPAQPTIRVASLQEHTPHHSQAPIACVTTDRGLHDNAAPLRVTSRVVDLTGTSDPHGLPCESPRRR